MGSDVRGPVRGFEKIPGRTRGITTTDMRRTRWNLDQLSQIPLRRGNCGGPECEVIAENTMVLGAADGRWATCGKMGVANRAASHDGALLISACSRGVKRLY